MQEGLLIAKVSKQKLPESHSLLQLVVGFSTSIHIPSIISHVHYQDGHSLLHYVSAGSRLCRQRGKPG